MAQNYSKPIRLIFMPLSFLATYASRLLPALKVEMPSFLNKPSKYLSTSQMVLQPPRISQSPQNSHTNYHVCSRVFKRSVKQLKWSPSLLTSIYKEYIRSWLTTKPHFLISIHSGFVMIPNVRVREIRGTSTT